MADVQGVRELPLKKPKGYQAKRRQKKTTEILKQAAKLLAEKGYQGFTVEDLADRVEMSKGNLYHYFPSKEMLLYACEKSATELVFDCVSAEVEKHADLDPRRGCECGSGASPLPHRRVSALMVLPPGGQALG